MPTTTKKKWVQYNSKNGSYLVILQLWLQWYWTYNVSKTLCRESFFPPLKKRDFNKTTEHKLILSIYHHISAAVTISIIYVGNYYHHHNFSKIYNSLTLLVVAHCKMKSDNGHTSNETCTHVDSLKPSTRQETDYKLKHLKELKCHKNGSHRLNKKNAQK